MMKPGAGGCVRQTRVYTIPVFRLVPWCRVHRPDRRLQALLSDSAISLWPAFAGPPLENLQINSLLVGLGAGSRVQDYAIGLRFSLATSGSDLRFAHIVGCNAYLIFRHAALLRLCPCRRCRVCLFLEEHAADSMCFPSG